MAGGTTLSARLRALADMVTRGNRVCDVGCDHGYLSIYLVKQGISPGALAMDVREGPLGHAREHVRAAGLEDYITLRLSDGLSAFEIGEAQTLVCAGMGGRLMQKILLREPHKSRSFQELILQPQSEISIFRKFLREQGYSVVQEDMIWEDGKFYPVIRATFGERQEASAGLGKQELEDRYGPYLLKMKHPILREYLMEELRSAQELERTLEQAEMSEGARKRRGELLGEIRHMREAISFWE